ncbi:hypothetical protein [Polaromonas glacialis]|uniref:hypothetical protein n=1 Tax=Polaromonas glacialis TaxID=866564 RepID=UPI000ACFC0DD|nr:hypothetical protein [Polaromonas glacialis]
MAKGLFIFGRFMEESVPEFSKNEIVHQDGCTDEQGVFSVAALPGGLAQSKISRLAQ